MNERQPGGLAIGLAIFTVIASNFAWQPSVAFNADDSAVIPGTRIGVVKLGMNKAQVTKALGAIDGSYQVTNEIKVEFAEWKEPATTYTFRVFFDKSEKPMQFGCEAPIPSTPDGISLKSSLTEVEDKYKGLKRSKYKKADQSIDYFDDVKKGIAFKFVRAATDKETDKHLAALVVHKANRPVVADAGEMPSSD